MSTSQVPVLIYSKDSTDITASLLKVLNKDAPAEKKVTENKDEDSKDADMPKAPKKK
jgi:hypothetical protein